MRSSRHNFSKILSNRNEILQTCSRVNVVVPNTFWVHSVQEFRSEGTSKWKNFRHAISGRIWKFLMNYILLNWNGSKWLETSFFHGWNGRHVWLISVVKLIFYDVIVMKERLWTQILFYRISRVRNDERTRWLFLTGQDLLHRPQVIWKARKEMGQGQSPGAHLWILLWRIRMTSQFWQRMSDL